MSDFVEEAWEWSWPAFPTGRTAHAEALMGRNVMFSRTHEKVSVWQEQKKWGKTLAAGINSGQIMHSLINCVRYFGFQIESNGELWKDFWTKKRDDEVTILWRLFWPQEEECSRKGIKIEEGDQSWAILVMVQTRTDSNLDYRVLTLKQKAQTEGMIRR